jgi:hypothetical protein
MNEYIEHGKTGWLFGPNGCPPLPGNAVAELRRTSYEAVVRGRKLWEAKESEFLDFVDSAPPLAFRGGQFKLGVVRALKKLKSAVKG